MPSRVDSVRASRARSCHAPDSMIDPSGTALSRAVLEGGVVAASGAVLVGLAITTAGVPTGVATEEPTIVGVPDVGIGVEVVT